MTGYGDLCFSQKNSSHFNIKFHLRILLSLREVCLGNCHCYLAAYLVLKVHAILEESKDLIIRFTYYWIFCFTYVTLIKLGDRECHLLSVYSFE